MLILSECLPLILTNLFSSYADFFNNKPIDLSILDNFDFDSNGTGGLPNGDLGLPSHNESLENHVPDIVSSPGSSALGVSGIASVGASSFSMATGNINPRDVMSPISSAGGMVTKAYSQSISVPSTTMMQQMPVSTMGMPTPATPHLSAEQNLKRSSEQTPQNGGMLSSLANSMPVSFGYSVQSTMANALLQRNTQNTGIVGSNIHNMNMMNKIQIPMHNMNFAGQNPRFVNANTMQMFRPGTMRMPAGPNQMNPALLKMQPFQSDIRHLGNQPQPVAMPTMNGPVGVQNNLMTKFQMNNNQMMAQVSSFILYLNFLYVSISIDTICTGMERSIDILLNAAYHCPYLYFLLLNSMHYPFCSFQFQS